MSQTAARAEEPVSAAQPNVWSPVRLVSAAGATVGLCILGDSLMYAILPLAASSLGIPTAMIGVLLSVNRFVRLGSNLWSSSLFERFGPRRPFVAASVLGVLSTVLYGLMGGFALLLPARLLWGVAWSGLRQGGYVAVWTGNPAQKGRLTGYLWGLVRLGSALSVVVGGFLYDRYGYFPTIWAIVALSALSIPVAIAIRWPAPRAEGRPSAPDTRPTAQRVERGNWFRAAADAVHATEARWLVSATFFQYLLSGVVLSTTSIYLLQLFGGDPDLLLLGIGIAGITGILQASRWLTDLALGPAAGFVSDRYGQPTTILALGALELSALAATLVVPALVGVFCLLLALLSDGMLHTVMSAAATGTATRTERPHIFVGVYTTLSDFGSALGPLAAYTIGESIGLGTSYMVVGAAMIFCMIQVFRLTPRRAAA
jgi:MFS family permease